jgi:hypothetical protein
MFVSIYINADKADQNVSFCCQTCGTWYLNSKTRGAVANATPLYFFYEKRL